MSKRKVSDDLANLCVNTIRMLSVDAIEKAKSGHPGLPMGMADCAFVLWTKFLSHNPADPQWQNRDRFILSAGHGSMLLYSLLYLSGYDLTLDDLKAFRQWGSRTPGHPEYGLPGIETTTGPLGQGFATGVGMALAQRIMADQYNKGGFAPVNHRIFSIVSDGDLMEGISSEAASFAGCMGLGNIIYIYDNNSITIEGGTSLTFTEDVPRRFEAYGWHTISIDGHNHEEIENAIEQALMETDRPSLICARTHIGYGSPKKQDTASAHGAPLGPEECEATKKHMEWPLEPAFIVPDEVKQFFEARQKKLTDSYNRWQKEFSQWRKEHPDMAAEWDRRLSGSVPENLEQELLSAVSRQAAATRAASGKVLNRAVTVMPWVYGGSADLGPSNKTFIDNASSVSKDNFCGRNIHFGIREHAMGAICTGMSLYGGFIPYASTFLVFSDYMKPSIRLAALMKQQVVYVFTHDSIFVGEDGPTHQPIEHVAALRGIPGLTVFRPADDVETALCWTRALTHKDGPTALCLTRQKVPSLKRVSPVCSDDIAKGAYTLYTDGPEDVVIVATGSEVWVAYEAARILKDQGISCRVVSMVSQDLFVQQDETFRRRVIPAGLPVAVIEAGSSQGWHAITQNPLLCLCIDRFGASAPFSVLAEKFGFTPESAAERIGTWLKQFS